ncbi:MAG: transketolase [Elusimicrobia bacterium RIFCSPHIGHO2_02_FULL_57_9]|nr:MAG: transketolase [Elusimicrobia bacterium RIFCSPHIGHO2_02_FULL_57_9]
MPAAIPETAGELKARIKDMRVDIIRMISAAGSGHPGGSLSVIDILAVLYSQFLRHDPKRPDWPDRDRVVLSKGHGCPALYTVMAYTGYFPKEQLMTLRQLGSPLQGHPDRLRLPGIEASTGSLGQGLSMAVGMALAGKMDKKDYRTYAVLGDGELQEGQCWEAIMCAPKFKLDHLTVIVDRNNGQIDGHVHEVMDIEPLKDKFESFRWEAQVIDGHDLGQIAAALDKARKTQGKPQAIIADTIKGKGVSFMEDNINWHGAAPKKEQADKAAAEIQGP